MTAPRVRLGKDEPAKLRASLEQKGIATVKSPVVSLQQSAGNRAATAMLPQSSRPTEEQQLEAARRAASAIEGHIETALYRRGLQEQVNREQALFGSKSWIASTSEVAGSIKGVFAGKGLHNLELPDPSLFDYATSLVHDVKYQVQVRNVVRAGRVLQDLSDQYARDLGVLNEYLEGVIGGAELATTGLEVVAAAGAVAAMIATGGVAAGGAAPMLGIAAVEGGTGLSVLATSGYVAAGAGAYGVAQQTATQSGEMIAGTREHFDLLEIAKRGGKDAVMAFFGSVTGGYLSKWAVPYAGRLIMSRMSPAQLAIFADAAGVNVAELTGPMFVGRLQQFVIDFLAGAASAPLMAALDVALERLGGKKPPSLEKFVHSVIESMVTGGLLQLFLAPFTHGASRAPGKGHGELSIAEVPPEMTVQTTLDATMELHAQPREGAIPIEETPFSAFDGPMELQSPQEFMAEVQPETASSFSEQGPAATFEPAPEITPQSSAKGTAELQKQAGTPKPGPEQLQVSPEDLGKPMEFRKTKTKSTAKNPTKAELEQSGPLVTRDVKAGSLIKGGKVQPTSRTRGAKSKPNAKRDITREEQMFDSQDQPLSKRRRKQSDKFRRTERAPGKGELKAGDPDPAFPGTKVAAAEQDHIVPYRRIRNMKGYAQLDRASQIQVENLPENLEMVSKRVNNSRLDDSYADWSTKNELGLQADPAWVAEMVAKEDAITRLIEQKIEAALKAAELTKWRWRFGGPGGGAT